MVSPDMIILFGSKQNISGDSLKERSFCVIRQDGEKKETEKKRYLNLKSDIAFNIVVYKKDDWDRLSCDKTSYAGAIISKGVIVYEKT